MDQITFNDICGQIHQSLIQGGYKQHHIQNWREIYKDGQFVDETNHGYSLVDLPSILRSLVVIDNGTEYHVIFRATALAFKESK